MIKIAKIGYAKKAGANWAYGVWIVMDSTGAKLYRETFGGDSRMIETMKKQNIDVEKVYGVQFMGSFGVRNTEKLPDIEEYTGKNYS